jgi:ATP-dependent DNA helicase RecQ
VRVLALTATADRRTEKDIEGQLATDARQIPVYRQSMDRPNIRLSVYPFKNLEEKLVACVQLLEKLEGSGIVYCATRDNVELVAEYLTSKGICASGYHAGFLPEDKVRLQKEFLQDKYKVLIATNALGMGIDKSNLRFVIHFDMPGSITAYYQEVGRAGRDGGAAEGVLLYDPADQRIQRHFIFSAQPSKEDFQKVQDVVANSTEPPTLTTIKVKTGLHPTRITVVVAELVEQGYMQKVRVGSSQGYSFSKKEGHPSLERYITQNAVRNRELEQMVEYGKGSSKECHMLRLRKALGDSDPQRCGRCCSCQSKPFELVHNQQQGAETQNWLQTRCVSIQPSKTFKIEQGVALLNGKLRTPDFRSLMQKRAESTAENWNVTPSLFSALLEELRQLLQRHQGGCILPIPSCNWGARDAVVVALAQKAKVPYSLNYLSWWDAPPARQGELHNNDQRRKNVHQKMGAAQGRNMPPGAIILFDDYVGSGATLKEAARALRKQGLQNVIVPLTIASIQWRLGGRGYV